ncbi:hypothetical protein [Campylobacter corcagiensis]|uniref:Uncharacterized protein n=1 Tax=Campylobacter corcagiensis TaxID=1448857 RepID=A0A7M1LJK4_9BACT|nr:hypothetical protein [Campylobacter corcagiensis]QKF65430.1 hypothetical protein CCORG_1598 [Campylobacter corcagiensis]QOQ87996.1 hypothetical protein IMC76_04155 [Campylobacter corcagiensis]
MENLKNRLNLEINSKFKGKNLEEKKALCGKIFEKAYDELKTQDLLNKDSLETLLYMLKSALIKEEEERLLALIYEGEKIRKEISCSGRAIKEAIFESFEDIESIIKGKNTIEAQTVLSIINETLVESAQLTDVIKEVSESVFLSILENGDDVEETAFEFSKNIVYKTLGESEFKKYNAISIAKTVLSTAVSVANESKIYTSDLLCGTVDGINAGTLKAMEKFKDSIKFAPDEISLELNETVKELAGIDSEYIEILRSLAATTQDPAKSELETILKRDYDNYLAKMVRISSDATAKLRESLEKVEFGDSYKEFSKIASEKLDELKKKGSKFLNDFDFDEKIESLKKEMAELDKNIRSKFSKNESTKELADRAFEASKDKVKKSKETSQSVPDSKDEVK